MLKKISSLGRALSRVQQKNVFGGGPGSQSDCETAGGQWVCVGLTTCGCVFDPHDVPEDE